MVSTATTTFPLAFDRPDSLCELDAMDLPDACYNGFDTFVSGKFNPCNNIEIAIDPFGRDDMRYFDYLFEHLSFHARYRRNNDIGSSHRGFIIR